MYIDLLPFVNDDERALMFIRYNYIGEEFSQPINRKETADTIKGEAIYQLFCKHNYVGFPDEIDLLIYDFCNKVMGNIGWWHNQIDGKPVNNPDAKKVYDRVYLRWKDLSPIARKFYSTHMYLTKTENGKDVILRDFDNLSVYDPATIKLHLRKTKDGKSLFRETIPFLPVGSKFRQNTRKEEVIDTNNQDYLRKDYDTKSITAYVHKINYSKFIKNVIQNSGMNVDLYKHVASSVKTLENLYPEEPELATLNFTRDENGVLIRDGVKLDDAKLEEDLKQAGICYGTGIKDSGSNCDDVYKCLLDVKPGDISRCAGELENVELFDVPSETVRKINPKIMKVILQNLGVGLSKQNGILICESFESWLSRTPIRSVVLKNRNLSRYISTIINVMRTNPVILNPKQSSLRTYGLSTFKTPEGLQNKSAPSSNIADLLLYTKNVSVSPLQSIPLYPDNLRFIMSGGAEYSENAMQLKKLFDVLFSELNNAGAPLVENDKNRIYATIEKMSKLELDLPRLLEDLKVYTDLIKLIGDKEKEDTKLDDFQDIRNNKSQLSDLVNKVNKKILANISRQNLIYQILYNRVQVPLLGNLVF
jgi:hypothetical protein